MDEANRGGTLEHLITRFRQWLRQPAEDDPVVEELASAHPGIFRTAVLRAPAVFSADTVRRLIALAHDRIGNNPTSAAQLCIIAQRLAENLPASEPSIALAGDAARERASALYSAGEYRDAESACREARAYYNAISPQRDEEISILGLIEGQVRHALGQSDEGLALIDLHANLLLTVFGNRKKYVEARIIYATVLVSRGEFTRGLQILEDSAAMAEEQKDSEVLAYILNNIGHCWLKLDNVPKAKKCMTMAADLFTSRNLKADAARCRGNLALILIEQGRYNEAISEHYIVRNIFLELRMPVVAAQAAMWIVELLFLAGRTDDVPALCNEVIATFTRAGLPRQAQIALGYLSALVAKRAATETTARQIREFLNRLEHNPDEEFVPMSGRQG